MQDLGINDIPQNELENFLAAHEMIFKVILKLKNILLVHVNKNSFRF